MEGREYICFVTAQTLKGFAKKQKNIVEKNGNNEWKRGKKGLVMGQHVPISLIRLK